MWENLTVVGKIIAIYLACKAIYWIYKKLTK